MLYALAAVVAGLLVLEGAAKLVESLGTSREDEIVDRFAVDSVLPFQNIDRQFLVETELGGRAGWIFSGVDQANQWVVRDKPPGQVRVVILGGSQAGGMGLAAEVSYARRLQKWLRERHAERDIQVINLAVTGYAAAQHAYLVRHVLPQLQPDLVLALFGHNERLDVKAMVAEGMAPPRMIETTDSLQRHSALARLLSPNRRETDETPQAGRPIPATHLDPQWQAFWSNRLTRSLQTIADTVRGLGAELIVCHPPSNLAFFEVRDWWWFDHLQLDPRLVRARHWLLYDRPEKAVDLIREVFRERRDAALELLLGLALTQAGRPEEAGSHLRAAVRLLEQDPKVPPEKFLWMMVQARTALGERERAASMVHEWIRETGELSGRQGVVGLSLRAIGESERAAKVLAASRDHHDMAFRADRNVRLILQRAAERNGLLFVDLDRAFATACREGICGFDMFIDYCHLTPVGHVRMAGLLLRLVEERLGLSSPAPDPAPAAEKELWAALRNRERDFPEIEQWLGVCDEIWQISDERLNDERCRLPEDAEDPISLVYRGNMELQNLAGSENITRAVEYYRQALAVDPDFAPALGNIEWIENYVNISVAP